MINSKHSKQWERLHESALNYQECLKHFFDLDDTSKLDDLEKALEDRDLVYYALRVIESSSNNIVEHLLEKLVFIVIYGSTSNSYFAKKIVLESNKQLLRKEICKILVNFSINEKENIETLKDIALFFYELQYKTELLQFVDENILALRESEFIESENDLKELYNMKDMNDN